METAIMGTATYMSATIFQNSTMVRTKIVYVH